MMQAARRCEIRLQNQTIFSERKYIGSIDIEARCPLLSALDIATVSISKLEYIQNASDPLAHLFNSLLKG